MTQIKTLTQVTIRWQAAAAVLIVFCVLWISGCTVGWVAKYDPASEVQLVATYKKINHFYDKLTDSAPEQRGYADFARRYADISTDLRVLLLQQRLRADNSESVKITRNIIDSWERTREKHKRYSADDKRHANPYPDTAISLDRQQFEDFFNAAVGAERAKK